MRRLFAHTFLLCLCIALPGAYSHIAAQSAFCPPNLDFENGNLSNWMLYTGKCCPVNITSPPMPIPGRHDLTSGNTMDMFGNFPTVAPGGGKYSLKLGNANTGAEAEMAMYHINVPSTPGNYTISYKYAVVLQDPSHDAKIQPLFKVRVYDSATGLLLPCANAEYVAGGNLPGFIKSPVTNKGLVYYLPWSMASVDLSPYTGTTVTVEFSTGDCGAGGHFGYAYVDMSCGVFDIKGVICNGDSSNITMAAPHGYKNYDWMDTAFVNTVGTGRIISIPKSGSLAKYALIVQPYPGYGCTDTFYTAYGIDTASISIFLKDTSVCYGSLLQLNPYVRASAYPIDYLWSPATGIDCINCPKPTTTATQPGTYMLVANDGYGCTATANVKIDIWPLPKIDAGADTGGCGGDLINIKGISDGAEFAWTPSQNVLNPTVLSPTVRVAGNTRYVVAAKNTFGCVSRDTVMVNEHSVAVADAGPDTIACLDDSVTVGGIMNNSKYFWFPATDVNNVHIANPKIRVTDTTVYHLAVVNSQGCHDTDDITIISHERPTAFAGNDTTVCKHYVIRLNGEPDTTPFRYEWISTDGIFNASVRDPFARVDTHRTYRLRVINPIGCVDSDEVKVTTLPVPGLDAGMDTTICKGETVQLNAKIWGMSGNPLWWPAAMLNNHTIFNPLTKVLTSDITFHVQVTGENYCTAYDSINIYVKPVPTANAGNDTGACLGTEIPLKATGGAEYYWDPPTDMNDRKTDTPRVIVNNSINYVVKVTNAEGCYDYDTVSVVLHPSPIANAGKDTSICNGERYLLNTSGGTKYEWESDPPGFSSASPTPSVHPTSSTRYRLIVTNGLNCHDTDDMFITVHPLPVADAGLDTVVCPGEKLVLNGNGGGSYLWTSLATIAVPSSALQNITVYSPVRYMLNVVNQYDCTDDDTVFIDTYPLPSAYAGADTTVCPGAVISLNGTGGGRYSWSPVTGLSFADTAKPLAVVNADIKYTLVVTSDMGCKDTAFVMIDTVRYAFSASESDTVCKGQSVELWASGGDRYQWQPASLVDDPAGTGFTFLPDSTIHFKVKVSETLCGREEVFDIIAVVQPNPVVDATAKNIDCDSDQGELVASGAVNYEWFPAEGLKTPYAAHTIAAPRQDTEYMVIGKDKFGCADTAFADIKVLVKGKLIFPDAFTPNNDGLNDCYRLFIPGDVTSFMFSVYNRYGQLIFQTSSRDEYWDGHFKGVRVELGTYAYYYVGTSSACGKITRTGNIHVVR